jgi:O-antigen ligase
LKHKATKRKPRVPVSPKSGTLLFLLLAAFYVSLPFVTSLTGFEKFRITKDIYTALFVLLIGSVAIISRPHLKFRIGIWEILLAVGVLYAGIHTLAGGRSEGGWSGFSQILFFVALFWLISGVISGSRQKTIWIWSGGALAVSSVLTVFQFFDALPFMSGGGYQDLGGRFNPCGFIGDVNTGGFLFGLVSLPLLFMIFADRNRLVRILAAVFLTLNLVGLAFTMTLTASVALAVSLAGWVLLHHWWVIKTQGALSRRLIIFWMVFLLGAAGSLVIFRQSEMVQRATVVFDQVRQGDWNTATSGRAPVYRITWQMIKQEPWLGRGLNSFGREFFSFRTEDAEAQKQPLINQPGAYQEVHNEYLQVWLELGIAGLVLLILLLLLPVFLAARSIVQSRQPDDAYWSGVMGLAALFVAVSCLGFFPFHLSVGAAFIVLVFGCLRNLQLGASGHEPLSPHPRATRLGIPPLAQALLVVAVAGYLTYPRIQAWRANTEMGFAVYLLEVAMAPGLPLQQKRLYADTALARLKRAESLAPHYYEVYNFQGSANMLLGRYYEAVRCYEVAARSIPSPEVLTNLASAHMAANEAEKARGYLQTALRYNAHYGKAHQALATLDQKKP